jgi:murein DD-endopeptidase MepM/ murein hydrolase activator NlpD
VTRLNVAFERLTQAVSRVLPARHFIVGGKPEDIGQHLTFNVGTRTQVMAIGSAVLVAGWLGVATTSMMAGSNQVDTALAIKQAELAQMQSKLQAMTSETAALKGDVAMRAQSLEARQAFLAALLTGKPDMARLAKMLPRQIQGGDQLSLVRDLVATVPATLAQVRSSTRVKKGVQLASLKTGPAVDIVEPFRQLESQQLALVDRATGAAEAKLRETRALITRLGLNPDRFVAASDWNGGPQQAVGGPYIPVSANAEPAFKGLFITWKKLNNLQAAVSSIPAYMPVKDYRYTSSFGVRYDPFNGGSAMHAGVDMAGSMGEPIYASADGIVSRAGVTNGYGNLVELDHGRGLDTRYGHMSKILVHAGEHVVQGQEIGRMGSTGRSTGTHLHFEVRVDGRAVNPRPFLEASAYVLAAKHEAGLKSFDPGAPQDFGPVMADDTVTASNDVAPMTRIHYR